MEGVSFSEEQATTRYATGTPKRKGIQGMVMSIGLAKTEKEANVVLIAIVGISLLVMAGVWIGTSSNHTVTPEQQRTTEWMKNGGVGRAPGT